MYSQSVQVDQHLDFYFYGKAGNTHLLNLESNPNPVLSIWTIWYNENGNMIILLKKAQNRHSFACLMTHYPFWQKTQASLESTTLKAQKTFVNLVAKKYTEEGHSEPRGVGVEELRNLWPHLKKISITLAVLLQQLLHAGRQIRRIDSKSLMSTYIQVRPKAQCTLYHFVDLVVKDTKKSVNKFFVTLNNSVFFSLFF